jgi:hypothetical protein
LVFVFVNLTFLSFESETHHLELLLKAWEAPDFPCMQLVTEGVEIIQVKDMIPTVIDILSLAMIILKGSRAQFCHLSCKFR